MILPINFLWNQLNGPQATAITQAIFNYWKSIFDNKLTYINSLSVDTANTYHLTFLGALANFVRPTVSEADTNYFYFTEDEEAGNHGFSGDGKPGGKFAKLGEGQGNKKVLLDAEYYRSLLRAFIRGKGEIGSLELLDDICYSLYALNTSTADIPTYKFVFMEGDNIPNNRAPGDVFLDMDNAADWSNPLHVYGTLKAVTESMYSPQPRVYVSISTDTRCEAPVATPPGGTYTSSQQVTLSCPTRGATVYYTLDGSNPSTSSPKYSTPITISSNLVIRAIATAPNYGQSIVMNEGYTINS